MTDVTSARGGRWRAAGWCAAAALFLAPAVAMRFTAEVRWGPGDFAAWGAMLLAAGGAMELSARGPGGRAYRAGAAVAVAAAFLLVWVNGAVGIVGSEREAANLLFLLAPGAALVGAVLARGRPDGTARAMLLAAGAQGGAGALALAAGWGRPAEVLGATALFGASWLLSAGLFRAAGRR